MKPKGPYCLGVDIGGTFTDCAIIDPEGEIRTGKVPTTPSDLAQGFFASIEAAAASLGLDAERVLAATAKLAHGTTAGVNALVTGSVARVALLTTKGHADAIRIMNDMGRALGASIEEQLDWSISSRPEPIVPREQVFEISERIDSGGDVVVGLSEADVEAALDRFAEKGIEAVAIAYLWSFANPAHEIRTREIVQRRFPELYVSCGFEVAPRISSYPRTTATVMNAQIGPLMRAYIDRIAEGARRRGYGGPLLLAQCDGGLLPAEAAREFPIGTLQSGPVGGIAGAAKASASLDDEDVIVADMGGTTFDVGAISGGVLRRRNESVVERHLTHLRKVEIESVGAGGGSVAWLDRESGALRVGPHSAGADPGPICYGRGGTQVTVTDADLVLGVLNAERPLAGGLRLDLEAARKAVAELGREIGLDALRCAAGIVEIVDRRMEDLLRRVTIQSGRDPRRFSLWAYGGASAAHVGLFASGLGVKRVLVPLNETASVWSACGCALLDQQRRYEASAFLKTPFDLDEMQAQLAQLERQALGYVETLGLARGEFELERSADLKYALQVFEVETPLPSGPIDRDWEERLVAAFERAYSDRFGPGTGYAAAGVTLTALRVVVRSTGESPALRRPPAEARSASGAAGARPVFWKEYDDSLETPIFHGPELGARERIAGPAIVEYPSTTVAVRPGQSLSVHPAGHLVLDLEEGA
ncbi:MAG: hydantoinase/oxoprolinase family protein [Proteobacteria bacterium]|nr:hydantoinase/oxoprolinase family protein [Pseudomonadota bacterium]